MRTIGYAGMSGHLATLNKPSTWLHMHALSATYSRVPLVFIITQSVHLETLRAQGRFVMEAECVIIVLSHESLMSTPEFEWNDGMKTTLGNAHPFMRMNANTFLTFTRSLRYVPSCALHFDIVHRFT